MIIDLKLNEYLIPDGHFVRHQLPNGADVVQKFTKNDVDLCHYKVSKCSIIRSDARVNGLNFPFFVLGDD